MGLGRSIKHAVKKVAKATKSTITSGAKAVTNLLQGDVKGSLSELANAATGGYTNSKAERTAKALEKENARIDAANRQIEEQNARDAAEYDADQNASSRKDNPYAADTSNLMERSADVNEYSTLLNGTNGVNREDTKVKRKTLLGGA